MRINDTCPLSRFWLVASNAVPPISFYLYLRHRRTHPEKALKALAGAVAGLPVALPVTYIMNTFILN
jgi:hypothetical protein